MAGVLTTKINFMNTQTFPLPAITQEALTDLVYSNGGNSPATIVFHEDAGHGWLQVPLTLVKQAGIAEKITKYSYMDKTFAYLEEDCDLSQFLNAIGIQHDNKEARDMFWRICPEEFQDTSKVRSKAGYQVN